MRFTVFTFLLLLQFTAFGQNRNLSYYFVKPNSTLKNNKPTCFNSLKIVNNSSENISLKTELFIPKGWQIAPFMELPHNIDVPASDSIFLPIKLLIPKYTKGGKSYKYRIDIFSDNNKFIGSTKAIIHIPTISEWKIEILEEELYLPFDSSSISFKTIVKNTGNKRESIEVRYRVQDKYAIKKVDLEPGTDTSLILDAEYAAVEDYKSANRDYIGVTASNGLEVQDKTVYFVKNKNNYNGLRATRRPNSIGLVYDNLPSQNFSSLGFRANGSISFKDESELSYFLINNNLSNRNDLGRSTIYRIQYLSESLDLGLGSTFDYGFRFHRINTVAGRRQILNGNNAASVTWRPYINSTHQTTIFVSRNVLQPITTVIGGHRFRFGRSTLETAMTYNLDFFGKRSLKIGSVRGRFPLGTKHYIDVLGNVAEESHHLLSHGDDLIDSLYKDNQQVIRDKSYNYRLFYSGNLFKGFNINISNAYTSPYYPNGERGFFNLDAQLTYQSKDRRTIRLGYRMQDKSPYTYQFGLPLYVFGHNRENIYLEYNMPLGTASNLRAGSFLQQHQTERLSNVMADFSTFQSNDAKIFFGGNTRIKNHQFRLNVLYGYAFVEDYMDVNGVHFTNIPRISTLNTQLEYNNQSMRSGINYIRGPNGTISQYEPNSADIFSEQIRGFVTWQKLFLKQKLRTSFSGSCLYQLNNERGNIALTPRIEYFAKNWTFDVNTVFNYAFLINEKGIRTQLNPRFQVGLYRNFYISPDEKSFDLDIVCFKDDNGNGQMEAHEFGISDVKVAVIPHKVKTKRNRNAQPLKLFSNHKGKLFFKKITKGEYIITIEDIHNNDDGYILKNEDLQIIDLQQNMVVYIPFSKANSINGKVLFEQSKYSKTKVDIGNIRVTAVSNTGETYEVLTDKNGKFSIPVPNTKTYKVTINNPFKKEIKLKQSYFEVDFEGEQNPNLTFKFYEKKRKVNFD